MGLGNCGRLGLANADPVHRPMAKAMAALLAGAATIALLTSPASAQQAAQPAADQADQTRKTEDTKPAPAGATLLDKILVISRTGKTAIESLASASHVDQEQLDRRMATTPNEMLLGVPGVAVQADARRVSSSINIRGLQDFGRVAVIVDGARQNFQRSDHGTQSTFYVDPELIKSVDVIRGPTANTYGSGAIGGVVFFDTKDAVDFLRPGETWAGSVTGRYESNGKGWTASASGAYKFNDDLDVLGNIVYRDYGDYKNGSGDTVAGTGFDLLSGLLKTTIRPSEDSELKLGWVGSSDGWTETSGGVPANDVDLKSNTFTARYNITDDARSWLDLHINASYNKTNLDLTTLVPQNRFDPSTGLPVLLPVGSTSTFDVGTAGVDIWNTSRFETAGVAHELTYGGDWVGDDVETGGTPAATASTPHRASVVFRAPTSRTSSPGTGSRSLPGCVTTITASKTAPTKRQVIVCRRASPLVSRLSKAPAWRACSSMAPTRKATARRR